MVKRFSDLDLTEVRVLLDSEVHEHRLAGLLILVTQFEKASRQRSFDDAARRTIAEFYLDAVERGG